MPPVSIFRMVLLLLFSNPGQQERLGGVQHLELRTAIKETLFLAAFTEAW